MRVSDYVFQKLKETGLNHVFMLSGGGIMYLVDSLGHSGMEYVCCHHEQAAGIAAQAYAMKRNALGACLVTTGPGGTNALTPCGAAYVDSTPVLFISGQVKKSDFASLRNVRQFGAQENDIVSMARPVTKYAVTVMEPENIRYHLEKALYLALHGRQGPVWLDIPLDVQNADVEVETLKGFDPEECGEKDIQVYLHPDEKQVAAAVERTIRLLKAAKRPLFLIGQGLIASGATERFELLCKVLKVPVVATWRALDVMDSGDECFFGSPGLQANRYSNLITQGADFLLVLGSRLDNMITAFGESRFAYRAQKVIVDIDENEIAKLDMPDVTPVVCDAGYFLENLLSELERNDFPRYTQWLQWCAKIKERYPLSEENQEIETELVDLYQLTQAVSEQCDENDTIVISSTSRCNTAGHMAFQHKRGQKTVSSMGYGSMGFALPSAVGAFFAGEGKRVVMFEGDGSLQLNLQEFQTIVHHNVNAKMFIFHNTGYAAIATMQDRNFAGFHVGADPDSGVTMPDMEKLASAYGIKYYRIRCNDEIRDTVRDVMAWEGAVICEFFVAITFDEIPKCISTLNSEGKRVSAALENPFPFLPESEMNEIYKDFA